MFTGIGIRIPLSNFTALNSANTFASEMEDMGFLMLQEYYNTSKHIAGATSDTISGHVDSIDTSYNTFQPDAAREPAVYESVNPVHSVVRFENATDDSFLITPGRTDWGTSGNATIVFKARHEASVPSTQSFSRIFALYQGGSQATFSMLRRGTGADVRVVTATNDGTGTTVAFNTSGGILGDKIIIAVVIKKNPSTDGGTCELYVDGSFVTSGTWSGTNWAPTIPIGLSVGGTNQVSQKSSGGDFFWFGYHNEALTATQIQDISNLDSQYFQPIQTNLWTPGDPDPTGEKLTAYNAWQHYDNNSNDLSLVSALPAGDPDYRTVRPYNPNLGEWNGLVPLTDQLDGPNRGQYLTDDCGDPLYGDANTTLPLTLPFNL